MITNDSIKLTKDISNQAKGLQKDITTFPTLLASTYYTPHIPSHNPKCIVRAYKSQRQPLRASCISQDLIKSDEKQRTPVANRVDG